jgi:diguanylate cyclase (GGDEF)-like protein
MAHTNNQTAIHERIDRLNEEAWSYRFSDLQRCRRLSQKALELAYTEQYGLGRAYALRNLGTCAYSSGEHEDALRLLTEGAELGRTLNDQVLVRDCLNFQAAVYASLGDFETASRFAEDAYRLSQHLQDAAGQVYGLMNLGVLYYELGRFEQALETHLEALEKSRAVMDDARELNALVNVGNAYTGLQRFHDAVSVFEEALHLAESRGLHERKSLILVNLGEALGHLGRVNEALEVLERARLLIGPNGPREGLAHCLLNEGAIYLQGNQPDRALSVLTEGLHEVTAIGSKSLQGRFHQELARTYKLLGNPAWALEHFETFHRLEREVRDLEAERRLRAFSAQHETEKARAEAEIERLRNVELAQALEALETKSRELERLVIQDPLTDLYNRRHLEAALRTEFVHAKQSGWPLPVALVDVDDFKNINDQFSHQVGDAVLVAVAQLLRAQTRTSDIVARYGGEEFAVVLPRLTMDQAHTVCERLREVVEAHDWAQIHPDLRVTISIGLASETTLENFERLLSAADARMYKAKRAGKNRVVSSG